jgi:hypothetical protein
MKKKSSLIFIEKKEKESNEHDIYPLIASVSISMNNPIQTVGL